jgi:hypothetical protein
MNKYNCRNEDKKPVQALSPPSFFLFLRGIEEEEERVRKGHVDRSLNHCGKDTELRGVNLKDGHGYSHDRNDCSLYVFGLDHFFYPLF